jgi:hypothetical protein
MNQNMGVKNYWGNSMVFFTSDFQNDSITTEGPSKQSQYISKYFTFKYDTFINKKIKNF